MTADTADTIDPTDAYAALADDPDAALVDVRTPAEWRYVGCPDLDPVGKQLLRIPWKDETGTVNDDFLPELRAAGVTDERRVFFLCRSGGRSQDAADAALASGYTRAFNVRGGFEGPPDEQGHRGTVEGWKVAGLPWRQP